MNKRIRVFAVVPVGVVAAFAACSGESDTGPLGSRSSADMTPDSSAGNGSTFSGSGVCRIATVVVDTSTTAVGMPQYGWVDDVNNPIQGTCPQELSAVVTKGSLIGKTVGLTFYDLDHTYPPSSSHQVGCDYSATADGSRFVLTTPPPTPNGGVGAPTLIRSQSVQLSTGVRTDDADFIVTAVFGQLDDSNPCTTDACDPATGPTHTNVASGTTCGSATTLCGGSQACEGHGQCIASGNAAAGTPCDDGKICNGHEACDGSGACAAGANAPSTTLCSDGNACNGMETCNGSGACVSGPAPSSFGNDSCTTASCDPQTGVTYASNGTCTTPSGVTPDPTNVPAPTSPTSFTAANQGLWSGDSVIDPTRAAVVRGRVLSSLGAPLSGVRITVPPSTTVYTTRSDGRYDVPVNGGGAVTLQFADPASPATYLTVQRQAIPEWHAYVVLPDVLMTPYTASSSSLTLGPGAPAKALSGPPSPDDSAPGITRAARTATLFFPPGIDTSPSTGGGTVQFRATEFTQGALGPLAMPGTLPATSAYTYAIDFSLVGKENQRVDFNFPVFVYVDDFINLPLATSPNPPTIVPAGYYDPKLGEWVPSDNGVVIEIVSITGGVPNLALTVDGNGTPIIASDTDLAAAGVSIATWEKTLLASTYPTATNKRLWRVPVQHFTDWDFNLGRVPVYNNKPPNLMAPIADVAEDSPCLGSGSIIECQNQILAEELPIVGTPYTLRYQSERVPDRLATVQIPLTSSDNSFALAPNFRRIEVQVDVAGRSFNYATTNAAPNQFWTWTWDRKDAYGRTVQGPESANISVRYVYSDNYADIPAFAGMASTPAFAALDGLGEFALPQTFTVTVGGIDARLWGLGGWSLDVAHAYSYEAHTVYGGDGTRRTPDVTSAILSVFAGGGSTFLTPSAPSAPARAVRFTQPDALAEGPDGSLYIADFSGVAAVYRVDRTGTATLFAGTGSPGSYAGDGVAPTATPLSPRGVAVGPDGRVYIADFTGGNDKHGAIRVVSPGPNPTISTFAGGGTHDPGDGLPATQATVDPYDVAVGPDGSVFISETLLNRIRRVAPAADAPSRIITTYAGIGGTNGDSGDCNLAAGGPPCAAATSVQFTAPHGLAVGQDGSVYVAEMGAYTNTGRIRKIDPRGFVTTVAGGGFSGPGGPATAANLGGPTRVAVSPTGELFIGAGNQSAAYRVGSDGLLQVLAGIPGQHAGTGTPVPPPTGPATGTLLLRPTGVAVGHDGSVYLADPETHTVSRVQSAAAQANGTIASADGEEVYTFDAAGKHMSTSSARSGAPRYTFGYDAAGLLHTIKDANNQTTTINHDGSGNPVSIVSPFGQTTTLVATGGFLTQVTNPLGNPPRPETTNMTYSTGGLLKTLTDPLHNTHHFTYTPEGLLIGDQDPLPGSPGQTLQRASLGTQWSVGIHSAGAREALFKVDRASGALAGASGATAYELWTNTSPAGLQSTRVRYADGTLKTTDPDGTAMTMQSSAAGVPALVPDPEWGSMAAYPSEIVQTLSSTSTVVRDETRSASGAGQAPSAARRTGLGGLPLPLPSNPASALASASSTTTTRTVILRDVNSTPATTLKTLDTFTPGSASSTWTTTTPAGRTVTRTLDPADRVTQVAIGGTIPMALAPVMLGYDTSSSALAGQLRTISQSAPTAGGQSQTRTITLAYDGDPGVPAPADQVDGWLYSITDGGGNITTIQERDADGRPTVVTLPGGRTVRMAYDSSGNLATVQPPQSAVHTFDSNAIDLLAQYTPPDIGVTPENTNYAYDFDHNLISMSGPPGLPMALTYDAAGRLIGVNDATTKTFTYDTAGRPWTFATGDGTKVTDTWDGKLLQSAQSDWTPSQWSVIPNNAPNAYSHKVTWGYDAIGRRTSFRIDNGTTYSIGYDPDGPIKTIGSLSITRGGDGSTAGGAGSNGNGLLVGTSVGQVADSYMYDGFGEVTQYTLTAPDPSGRRAANQPVVAATYGYDAAGRVTSLSETVSVVTNNAVNPVTTNRLYNYDAAMRLWRVFGNSSQDLLRTYTYDEDSNTANTSATAVGTGNSNRNSYGDVGHATYTYFYDAQHRMTALTAQASTTASHYTLDYTNNGEIAHVTQDGSTSTFSYDVEGNLRRLTGPSVDVSYAVDGKNRRVAKVKNGALQYSLLYGDDDLRPLGMFDGANNLVETFLYATRRNVPDVMIDGNGVAYRLVTDRLGSVQLVINAASGAVAQQLTYDEFGVVLADTNPGFQPFGFAGGLYDPDTTLVRFGAREYFPFIGRWLSKDQSRFGGGWNLYGYANNDPVNFVDQDGHFIVPLIGVAVGLGIFAYDYFFHDPIEQAQSCSLPGAHNGPQDAYRHCLAACRVSSVFGEAFAAGLGDVFEGFEDGRPGADAWMDEVNNRVGAKLGDRPHSDCEARCLGAVQENVLQLSPQ